MKSNVNKLHFIKNYFREKIEKFISNIYTDLNQAKKLINQLWIFE